MDDEEVAALQAAAEKLNVDVLNTRFVLRDVFSWLLALIFLVQRCQEWPWGLCLACGFGYSMPFDFP
jgi:hypothetical protein